MSAGIALYKASQTEGVKQGGYFCPEIIQLFPSGRLIYSTNPIIVLFFPEITRGERYNYRYPAGLPVTLIFHTTNPVIKHKTGLRNLAEELRNVSKACKIMGVSCDTFYCYRELTDTQIAARERKASDDEACGEIETAHSGYPGSHTLYVDVLWPDANGNMT